MIVTRLIGGLGNQMFQYAAGRALALRRGVPLALDLRGFENYRRRSYRLDHFAIETAEPSPKFLPKSADETRLSRIVRRLPGWRRAKVYSEKTFLFDQDVAGLPDGTYLDGYWQSYRYFSDCADRIVTEFTLRLPPSAENEAWIQEMSQVPSVALHVRRGDYVASPDANAVHGTCPVEYYVEASKLIQRRIGEEPVFYVFSDDLEWVQENIQLPHKMNFISHNGEAGDCEDLRLMSSCRHAIIANSTFSWWGAWLNRNPDKTIVAPAQWFRTDALNDRDLIPGDWLRV